MTAAAAVAEDENDEVLIDSVIIEIIIGSGLFLLLLVGSLSVVDVVVVDIVYSVGFRTRMASLIRTTEVKPN